MTWIKLNDNVCRHPKIAGLTDRGFRVWIQALCYASEFLTDGVLPPVFLDKVSTKVRAELFSAGLWFINSRGGVSIHDYLEHQSSKGEVAEERARSAKNSKEYRQRRRRESRASSARHRSVIDDASSAVIDESSIQRSENRGTEVQPPNPLLAKGADIRVRREHREHAKVVLKSLLGYCQHDPPCPNQGACVEVTAYHLAAKAVASC
jgi:hypothetical protein